MRDIRAKIASFQTTCLVRCKTCGRELVVMRSSFDILEPCSICGSKCDLVPDWVSALGG